MILKDLINKSYYGTIGYISSLEDLETLESYILYNLPILKEYKEIIISTNFKSYPQLVVENTNLWKKYFPNCILLDSKINRGHNFGTADLDNMLFDYCKSNSIQWLCKSSNDIILQPIMLDKQIKKSDFYYLSSMGFGGMEKYNFNISQIIKDIQFPQSNFYFINVEKTDFLNDVEYLNKTYKFISELSNYNGKVWEYVKNWTCERFLNSCIKRNNLTTHHLISEMGYKKLLKLILDNQVHDCSHKNIMIEGICHFQFPNKKILIIE